MSTALARLEDLIGRIADACEDTLLPFRSETGDRLLCRLSWSPEGFQDAIVSSGPLARMERVSRHREIEAAGFEKNREDEMRELAALVRSLPGGEAVDKVALEIYMPDRTGSARIMCDIGEFAVTTRASGAKAIAAAIARDLAN